jgi:hypothetical protein
MHSPPVIEVTHAANISHASLLEILVEMEDADGIDATCSVAYSKNGTEMFSRPDSIVADFDGSGIWTSSWLVPAEINDNISLEISCVDWSGNMVNYSSDIIIEQKSECEAECESIGTDSKEVTGSYNTVLIGGVISLLLVSILVTLRVRARGSTNENAETWHLDQAIPETDSRIPEGWTLEEFLNWLDGPIPDEWEEAQWEQYRNSLEDLR